MTALHLVRHGESEWNVIGLVQGQAPDIALTERGRRQAAETADRIAALAPTQLITSDLRRAVETATFIESTTGLVATPDKRLRERSYGTDEGRPRTAVPALGHPRTTSPGGESFTDVVARIGSWLTDLTDAADHAVIVAVTHGDVITAAINCLDPSVDQAAHANCAITTIDLKPVTQVRSTG